MTGAAVAETLVARGLDPAELVAKRGLMDLVLADLRGTSGSRGAEQVWWVPGRLEVFGKHTDYAGGRTLVCAVPRGLVVAANARADGTIHVLDARRGEHVTLAPPDARAASQKFTGWRHYVEVVARRLARNFPGSDTGADIVIASDLPRASGMSSSSTLIVGLASALARVANLEARREWSANIRSTLDAAGYYACIENGRTFGTLEGDAGVGTHGGSEDHAAILTGRPGQLSAFAFVPMRHVGDVQLPEAWRFVLSPCGVRAAKTGAAQGSYNRLSHGTQALLDLWNSREAHAPSLGAALGDGHEEGSAAALDRMRELVRRSHVPDWTAESLERRLDHFVREDARIPQAVAAIRESDAAAIGELAAASQREAETLLGNQIAETSALAQSARNLGAFAACSFGAGFGGSVWALVERDRARPFAARWHNEAFLATPGPPLSALR